MAIVGARYVKFAPIEGAEPATGLPEYGDVETLGKLIRVDVSVQNATGELYADDALAESITEFISATANVETDEVSDETAAIIYGATYDNATKKITHKAGDTPPYGGLGFVRSGVKDGVKYHTAVFYPKAKAALADESTQTKNNSIAFGTSTIPFTVFALNDETWKVAERYTGDTAYADAKARIDALFAGTDGT